MDSGTAPEALRALARSDYGRTVALLARQCGDLAEAEEAVQGAFDAAAASWPERGVPPEPRHWLVAAARDLLRRGRRDAAAGADVDAAPDPEGTGGPGHPDDPGDPGGSGPAEPEDSTEPELGLALFCAHPALSAQAQVVLTLRYVGGLSPAEIATAFDADEDAVLRELAAARATLGTAAVALDLPAASDRAERLTAVLDVVHRIYNEGYVAGAAGPLRPVLCEEGARLADRLRLLVPDDPEALGLAALILLLEARRPARVDAAGELVPLAAQDRSRWDAELLAEGRRLVRECVRIGAPGTYQISAAIQAVHAAAAGEADTDWGQILALYDQLTALTSSPSVAASRAVAVAHVLGPEAGLAALQAIPWADPSISVIRADLLARLGRSGEAAVLGSLGANRPTVGTPEPGGLLGYGDALLP